MMLRQLNYDAEAIKGPLFCSGDRFWLLYKQLFHLSMHWKWHRRWKAKMWSLQTKNLSFLGPADVHGIIASW